jgi:pSer/pThr/pTyr-binding forkhead associated (FHA) protein
MERSWIIGSAADCDLVVNRPGVSGRHCRLTRRPDGYLLEDLGSADGTRVNGTPVVAPVFVRRSDLVLLGTSTPLPWPDDGVAFTTEAATAVDAPRKILRIGREPDNDLVINLPTVSSYHARVLWHGGEGEAILEDLGSSNGTAVGTPDQKTKRALLRANDMVYLGSHALPASTIFAKLGPGRATPLRVGRAPLVLGRDPSCDRVVADPVVSGRHARLVPQDDGSFLVEDLGSSNGTDVNGIRVDRTAAARPGDTLGLGSVTFLLEAVTSSPTVPLARPTFDERSLVPTVPTAPERSPVPPIPKAAVRSTVPTPVPMAAQTPGVSAAAERSDAPERWNVEVLAALVAGPLLSLGFSVGSRLGGPSATSTSTLLARLALVSVGTGMALAVAGRPPIARGLSPWARRASTLTGLAALGSLAAWGIAAAIAGTAGGLSGLGLLSLSGSVGSALGLAVAAMALRMASR